MARQDLHYSVYAVKSNSNSARPQRVLPLVPSLWWAERRSHGYALREKRSHWPLSACISSHYTRRKMGPSMPVLAMVKAKWILFDLEAPQFIWVAAALLLLGTLAQSSRLWWLIAREKALHRRVIAQLEAIQAEYRAPARTGLAEDAYAAVVQVFREHPLLLPAWHNFEAQMLRQADAAGQLRWWATASASNTFNAAALPGMLTGMGLLCMFVAI